MTKPNWTLQKLPIAEIKEFQKNPRLLTQKARDHLKKSLDRFGLIDKPIMNADKTLIGGHQRLHILQEQGIEEVECWVPDRKLTDKEFEELNIRLNKNTAEWDFEMLANEWDIDLLCQAGFDLKDLGIDEDELEGGEGEGDQGTLSPPENPITQLGDLYELGDHRLLCGDSTDSSSVAKLLNGDRPILMVTDPPYGVEYDPSWRVKIKGKKGVAARAVGKVKNDDRIDWTEAWKLFPGSIAYVWHGAKYTSEVEVSLENVDFEMVAQIIWVKQHFALSRGDYHWQHEPCWYAVKKSCQHNWQGARDQATTWNISNLNPYGGGEESADDERTAHSTQKPIECMARPIKNNTAEGEGVYDPFSGSGTTLIAAEKLNRKCYAMELDPAYCDIIVKRWIDSTGKKAIKNGEEIEEFEYAESEET